MKAILLAGGAGTRLRPLTFNTPKPVVPVFNRPLLLYQLDLLRQVPLLDEVILSLNYQPSRIKELLGDGHDLGLKLRYVVEPTPLGTAGALKYAQRYLDETTIVFNGDVLSQVDLPSIVQFHHERAARATIVLTPVEDPSAYGLVETDANANVQRFLEKPTGDQITCNTINAGIYVIETDALDRIPDETNWSTERRFFPELIEHNERFLAFVSSGYWIDIGTPNKYRQVHHDIMDGLFSAAPFDTQPAGTALIAKSAKIDKGVKVEGPCFIDEGVVVNAGSRIGPYTVLGRECTVKDNVQLDGSIVWPHCQIEPGANLADVILGRDCQIGKDLVLRPGTILGDKSVVTQNDSSGA